MTTTGAPPPLCHLWRQLTLRSPNFVDIWAFCEDVKAWLGTYLTWSSMPMHDGLMLNRMLQMKVLKILPLYTAKQERLFATACCLSVVVVGWGGGGLLFPSGL